MWEEKNDETSGIRNQTPHPPTVLFLWATAMARHLRPFASCSNPKLSQLPPLFSKFSRVVVYFGSRNHTGLKLTFLYLFCLASSQRRGWRQLVSAHPCKHPLHDHELQLKNSYCYRRFVPICGPKSKHTYWLLSHEHVSSSWEAQCWYCQWRPPFSLWLYSIPVCRIVLVLN